MRKKTNCSRPPVAGNREPEMINRIIQAIAMSYQTYRKKRRKNPAIGWIAAVLAVLTVCCAYAGRINPNDFFLAPFMALAYMPMLFITLVAVVVLLFCSRRWALVLIVALMATIPVFKMFVPLNTDENRPTPPVDTTAVVKVMTYNVLGFNYNEPDLSAKPSESIRLILEANPDVVLLQEGGAGGHHWLDLPSVVPFQQEIKKRYPYYYNSADGLNIMSKYPFTTLPLGARLQSRSPLGYNRDQTSHLARAYDLQLPSGKQLRLVDFRLQSYHLSFAKGMNVRVSPDVKPSPLERMRRSFSLRGSNAETLRRLLDASPANLIVCGDMNDVTDSHVYRTIRGDDLNDAWCDVGLGYANTYNRHGLKYRIDHVLYRGAVRPFEAVRIKGGSSDHYPLMVSFDLDIN